MGLVEKMFMMVAFSSEWHGLTRVRVGRRRLVRSRCLTAAFSGVLPLGRPTRRPPTQRTTPYTPHSTPPHPTPLLGVLYTRMPVLVAFVFVYACVGTLVTGFAFGRRLASLEFLVLAREGDLRFDLVRARENSGGQEGLVGWGVRVPGRLPPSPGGAAHRLSPRPCRPPTLAPPPTPPSPAPHH